MNGLSIRAFLGSAAACVAVYCGSLSSTLAAEPRIYTYVNASGLRVITNIPPPGSIHLTVTDTDDQSTVTVTKIVSKPKSPASAPVTPAGTVAAPGAIDGFIQKYANHYNL